MAVNNTLIGEICHIQGVRPGSARYDPCQTDVERHAYANLVLMCPSHHTVIDDDEEAYTVERLCKIKTDHEARSTPIPDAEVAAVAEGLTQSVTNIGQSGGFSAHTVNASAITFQSAPSTSHLTHQRQIEAVERLWQVLRNLSHEFSSVVFIDTILLPSELEAFFREGENGQIADCLGEYADDRNLALRKLASAGANDADSERPFVTNRVWSVFFVLRAIYARAAILVTISYKERKFSNWRTDTGCDQLLRAILPAKAVDHAKSQAIGGLRNAIESLESQFLAEAGMNKLNPKLDPSG